METIHILLSTYNGEKYLKQQLDSVLSQVDVHPEIYIRDDGSTDTTIHILKNYQKNHDNIHVQYENNIGYVQSFWQLVQDSHKADYYAFCDQDDIWDINKCISAIQLLKKEAADLPLLYTSNVLPVNNDLEPIADKGFDVESVLSYPESLARGALPGCTYVFNDVLMKEIQKYQGPQISHDWTVYLICNAIGKIIYDPTSHIRYRIHGDNTVGTHNMRLSKKIHRFISGEYKGIRSSIARSILTTYGRQMNKENYTVTKAFANQNSLALLRYHEYRNLNFMIQLFTKRI